MEKKYEDIGEYGVETFEDHKAEEEQKAKQIATSMKEKYWVAPATTIQESIALYKRLKLLVSCDSGPLHLCSALGVPTVSLFGPTDPVRNGAYGLYHEAVYKMLPCSFCWKKKCPLKKFFLYSQKL